MPYAPRPGDLPIEQLVDRMLPPLRQGAQVYLKCTCPACGERYVSDQPLTLDPIGRLVLPSHLIHTLKENDEPCMHSVVCYDASDESTPYVFGFMVVYSNVDDLADQLTKDKE